MQLYTSPLLLLIVVSVASAASLHGQQQQQQQHVRQGRQLQPQQQQQQQQHDTGHYNPDRNVPPMDYQFEWNVDAQDYNNYYGHQEAANDGRVDGGYYVLLADGRLMRVTYYVDGNSGFVPTITYEDNYNPTWGTTAFRK